MNRFDWERRRDMIVGLFVTAFVGALAVVLAVWLLAAVLLGSVELARRLV